MCIRDSQYTDQLEKFLEYLHDDGFYVCGTYKDTWEFIMDGNNSLNLSLIHIYLEYCTYRKELDQKTVKAYRIDLNQYFTFVACEEPDKERIEEYITDSESTYFTNGSSREKRRSASSP